MLEEERKACAEVERNEVAFECLAGLKETFFGSRSKGEYIVC